MSIRGTYFVRHFFTVTGRAGSKSNAPETIRKHGTAHIMLLTTILESKALVLSGGKSDTAQNTVCKSTMARHAAARR